MILVGEKQDGMQHMTQGSADCILVTGHTKESFKVEDSIGNNGFLSALGVPKVGGRPK